MRGSPHRRHQRAGRRTRRPRTTATRLRPATLPAHPHLPADGRNPRHALPRHRTHPRRTAVRGRTHGRERTRGRLASRHERRLRAHRPDHPRRQAPRTGLRRQSQHHRPAHHARSHLGSSWTPHATTTTPARTRTYSPENRTATGCPANCATATTRPSPTGCARRPRTNDSTPYASPPSTTPTVPPSGAGRRSDQIRRTRPARHQRPRPGHRIRQRNLPQRARSAGRRRRNALSQADTDYTAAKTQSDNLHRELELANQLAYTSWERIDIAGAQRTITDTQDAIASIKNDPKLAELAKQRDELNAELDRVERQRIESDQAAARAGAPSKRRSSGCATMPTPARRTPPVPPPTMTMTPRPARCRTKSRRRSPNPTTTDSPDWRTPPCART